MSNVVSSDTDVVVDISQAYFVKYGIIAALAVIVYDYFLTLGDEISLVWPSRWNFTKVLFLLNRYLSFADVALATEGSTRPFISIKDCLAEYRLVVYFYTAGLCMAENLIGIRTYAVWKFDKRILCFLTVVYSGFFAGAMVFLCAALRTQTSVDIVLMEHGLCVASTSDGRSWPAFMFLMLNELVVILLTMIQWYSSARNLSGVFPLSRILYRDGMVFYLVMLGMSIINLSLMLAGPPAMSSMMQMPMKAIHSVLCSRMLLNIRGVSLAGYTTNPSAIGIDFVRDSHLAYEDIQLQDLHERDTGPMHDSRIV